jgi:molybdate transport system substrate-binding protein
MIVPRLGLAWLCAAVVLAGCGSPKGGEPTSRPVLRVAAASDLQTALPAVAERFQAASGVEVVTTFGSSGQLADQIRAGAPFDVFLSANRAFVEALAAEKVVKADSVRPYAQGSLVLAVNREANAPVMTLADLARPEVKKVALANPDTAPYGAAAKQALQRAGLWDALGRDRKIAQSETVRQALQYVQTGNAEAGLVGRAIARVPEVRIVEVDPGLYDPIVQSLGITARTGQPEAAERFARFVLGDEGQAMLRDSGFAPPPSGGAK